MRKKVVRIGSSAGVTISPDELRALGVTMGDMVEVTVRAGVLEVVPADPFEGRSDQELLTQVDTLFGARP